MLLSEVFNQLTYGELAQYFVAGKNGNGIQFESYPEIIAHINLGLTALHKRFILSRKQIAIIPNESIHTYYLDVRYLIGNDESLEPVKYLLDSEDYVFTGDVINIEKVYDYLGEEVSINRDESLNNIKVNTYNSIWIKEPKVEKPYNIIYVADHPRLNTDTLYPHLTEVNIPPALLSALLLFVASRIAAGNPTLSPNNIQDSASFFARYEYACNEVEQKNLLRTEEFIEPYRFINNGWI